MNSSPEHPRFPGIRVTTNGNQLVSYHTEARLTDAGVFYPITPSTEMGENYQLSFAQGNLNVFGRSKVAIEAEGEHAAQGGAIAMSVTGKRVVNFTSGQGVIYGLEQYYHAPGKLSTLVVEVAARALTKHALNVHCGHDDVYAALDTGWTILFARDSQQAADQALILRRVNELSLNPGINVQDGFLTSHLERTFYRPEAELIRTFLGAPDDIIECPTEAQRKLFGPTRRRVPALIDLADPMLLGPVQNQEHYMNGVIARRNNFSEPILGFLEEAYEEFARLTGRRYGLVHEYRCEDAETVFISLGSAAENIEAAVDYLRATRDAKVGSLHINVLRPFPEAAVVRALAGKKRAIILERTDEPLAGNNPLTRDVRTALSKARENAEGVLHAGIPAISHDERPRIFSGVYGLGSRDFRPEGILGAFEFVHGQTKRQDGKGSDETPFFVLGVDHPYAVESEEKPSLLPDGAIAVRLHSIGGWGMITTGKNLSEIIGAFGDDMARERGAKDEYGRLEEILHVSANPKYGSEKKGAPTAYYLVVAPERIRVNCDLRHVSVVLCCDPKAFTHSNPIDGMREGGTFVWESHEEPEVAWTRIPPARRREIIDKKIRVFTLSGFEIAREATPREDLQLRMQGNAFLGAFFRVSGFLEQNGIGEDRFREVVEGQYEKKFGRFGKAVVASNMTVMEQGFERVREIPIGDLDAEDRSSMRGKILAPCGDCGVKSACPSDNAERLPLSSITTFDSEFRAGLGYFQPASALASVGVMAPATGATASKYVARRETPVWIAENCTQCMECIEACPDTALPNTAQDLSTILVTAARAYAEGEKREALLAVLPEVEVRLRDRMHEVVKEKGDTPFTTLVRETLKETPGLAADVTAHFVEFFERVPFAFAKTPAVFKAMERKEKGSGGVFGIFVSDLCKGCGECAVECGDKEALVMHQETEQINADHGTGIAFLDLLPDTPERFLGKYDPEHPEESHELTLRNHLMVRTNYEALVSGDGACAGCGEKTVLHAVASLTEAYMRPIYHRKADRMEEKAARLEAEAVARLDALESSDAETHARFRRAVAQHLMGLGGEDDRDTDARIEERGGISNQELVDALTAVLRHDAFLHRDLQAVEGRHSNGMSVMAMGAHTGCNTVYGSTPPNNPHPYPWMNSLFQDGATVAWLFGESFILDHARRSVIPERLADVLLAEGEADFDAEQAFMLAHMTDAVMTDQEVRELPKVWAIGGDGGMGDIGFQNVSKVVLQNRPNVKVLMLDTQLYSNTGGQNSDSTPMPGGGDMNQFGYATEGKYTEKKSVSEAFLGGHGSPFISQVSMASAAKLFRAILDGLEYRGTAYLQCHTPCQPEHGIPDAFSTVQASRMRDSRGMPEFEFNPSLGESYALSLSLKGNPAITRDWATRKDPKTGEKYHYTTAHWAITEARFRRHFRPMPEGFEALELDDVLAAITQDDVVHRRFLDPTQRSYVPDFGVAMTDHEGGGRRVLLSRQMVLFCVERRRAWRMLQSRAGIVNVDFEAQRAALEAMDGESSDKAEPHGEVARRVEQELARIHAT
ncbi:MAG TPA: oxidoreductase [Planctomycetes bacterium]|nr:oxidoreductase [Planctomycetota bacterium]